MSSPAEVLDDLALWTLGLPEGDELLLMLRVLCDESHDSKAKVVMTMAGILAPKEAWIRLWAEWEKALATEHVTVFHANACEAGEEGEFTDWPRPKIEAFQKGLIEIITNPSYGLRGYSCSVPIEAHNQVRPRLKKMLTISDAVINGPLDHPWLFVFQSLVSAIGVDSSAYSPEEKIGFVFDMHDLKARARLIYHVIHDNPLYQGRLEGGVGFRKKEELRPLQAADLFAYETFLHFHDKETFGRPERWQYLALRSIVKREILFSAEDLERYVAAGEEGAAEAVASGRATAPRIRTRLPKAPYKPTPYARLRRVVVHRYRSLRKRLGL